MKEKYFFLNAPGGTGKTFLINLLLAKVIYNRKNSTTRALVYNSLKNYK